MSDWDDFDEDKEFEVKKEGQFAEEKQVQIEKQDELKPLPKTAPKPKQAQKKQAKKFVEDDDDDILGDKQSYKKRQEIMARKAAESDVTKMFENDIDEDIKNSIKALKFEEPLEYSQVGYLLGKEFIKEKHETANINTFFEDMFDRLQEKFTSKEFQAIGKQISSIVIKKQKQEKLQLKQQKSKTVSVKVEKETYELDDDLDIDAPAQDQDDGEDSGSDGFM